ncbi:hypothetical protein D9C73_000764 [Collichthys lucidus]|uniref:Uncharacterized protein n=1 Tax=Collichthys lucidus TaxID=240159 RepID=A0A4V6AQ09_COLLU|nr:hypothetical protein D9C73_000764 [Collichthys lucidus]
MLAAAILESFPATVAAPPRVTGQVEALALDLEPLISTPVDQAPSRGVVITTPTDADNMDQAPSRRVVITTPTDADNMDQAPSRRVVITTPTDADNMDQAPRRSAHSTCRPITCANGKNKTGFGEQLPESDVEASKMPSVILQPETNAKTQETKSQTTSVVTQQHNDVEEAVKKFAKLDKQRQRKFLRAASRSKNTENKSGQETKKKLYSIRRYKTDLDFQTRKKKYMTQTYNEHPEVREKKKAYVTSKYACDQEYRQKQKTHVTSRYACDQEYRQKQKTHVTSRYACDQEYRQKQKQDIQTSLPDDLPCNEEKTQQDNGDANLTPDEQRRIAATLKTKVRSSVRATAKMAAVQSLKNQHSNTGLELQVYKQSLQSSFHGTHTVQLLPLNDSHTRNMSYYQQKMLRMYLL